MTEIRKIPIAMVREHGGYLIKEYANESSIDGLPAPDPAWNMYDAMEQNGFMHTYGVFVDDVMVGFLIMLVAANPHYNRLLATTESFYVHPDYRNHGRGMKLLRHAEEEATKLGAIGFLVSAPAGGRLAKVMPRVGYRRTNEAFFKGL